MEELVNATRELQDSPQQGSTPKWAWSCSLDTHSTNASASSQRPSRVPKGFVKQIKIRYQIQCLQGRPSELHGNKFLGYKC